MKQLTNSSGRQAQHGYASKILKALYGHKGAENIWNALIQIVIFGWGFVQSIQDETLHFLGIGNIFVIFVTVDDDMAFASNDRDLLENINAKISFTFRVKLPRELISFMGWEIHLTPTGLYLSQCAYIRRSLSEMQLSHLTSQPKPLPTTANLCAIHEHDIALNPVRHAHYPSVVGGLMYIAVCIFLYFPPCVYFGSTSPCFC